MGLIRDDEIIYDNVKSLGKVTFLCFVRTQNVFDNVENTKTDEIKGRVYRVLSSRQSEMLEVILPVEAGEKNFNKGEEVELVDFWKRTIASDFGAGVRNYVYAKDMVRKTGATNQVPSPQTKILEKKD